MKGKGFKTYYYWYEFMIKIGSEWLLEDTIELKIGEEVTAVHLEWIPKHDAQHILALAITDMVRQ